MAGNYKRKDHFYQKAKQEGFSSRAAYKLEELDRKLKLFKPGRRVLDLGSWPGGWLEYAAKRVGPDGCVVGADQVQLTSGVLTNPIVHFFCGDLESSEFSKEILERFGGFDVVQSDMSAKLSGIKYRDAAMSFRLLETAMGIARVALKRNGVFVAKFFPGQDCEELVREARKEFSSVRRISLQSSRKTSKEMYLSAVKL